MHVVHLENTHQVFHSHVRPVAAMIDSVEQGGCLLFRELGILVNMLNIMCQNMPVLVSSFIHLYGQSVIQKVLNEHLPGAGPYVILPYLFLSFSH